MTQVKEFSFLVGGDVRETIIRAYSLDQAKRLLRDAIGVSRLPPNTVVVTVNNCDEQSDDLALVWEKEEVALAKKDRKDLKDKGQIVTVFLFDMPNGERYEIVETNLTRAKALLRDKLDIKRLPNGVMAERIEKIVPMKRLERELARKAA